MKTTSKFLLPLCALLTLLVSTPARAGSATWDLNPGTNNWNTDANWTPSTGYPNGPSDVATFDVSNTTAISISGNNVGQTTVAEIIFNSGSSAFTITENPGSNLTISGTGITNNSAITQNFETAVFGSATGSIQFTNSATAGSNTSFTNDAGGNSGVAGFTTFSNTASAGSATFTNSGGGGSQNGGRTQFLDSATAGNSIFTNSGGTAFGASGGSTQFYVTSTAGSASFTNNGGATGAGGGSTVVSNSATAGSATVTNNGGAVSGANGGATLFNNASSAGSGTFINNGPTNSSANSSGSITFFGTSTAGSAAFTNNGGTISGTVGASIGFFDTSSAGNATLTNDAGAVTGAGGGVMQFSSTSTAGNAALIANGGNGNGGSIQFYNDSTGGTASVEVFNNGTGTPGNLDISFHNAPGVTIGSLEGSGNVFLGAHNLTVGSSNLSKTFSGVIQDGGLGGGTGGSLTKIGKANLTLTAANTYTGGSTISQGTLVVKNRTGSATGPGTVQVNTGTLSGTGIINGTVAIGTGTSSKAFLLPGNSATKPGTLTINNMLTFNSGSTYKCVLNRPTPVAGKVSALGVTINSHVSFTFVDTTTGTLTTGTVFTVINNTSTNPIAGTFLNLADGSTFTSNGTTFKASYEGGNGNDLTLTVE
jgi:hypothetical protein